MKKSLIIVLVSALVFCLFGCSGNTAEQTSTGSESEPVELIIAHSVQPTHGYAVGIDFFEEAYAEIGDGTISFNEQGAGVLGSESIIIESTLLGDIDIAFVGDLMMGAVYPHLYFYNFPGVLQNYEEVDEKLINGWIGEYYRDYLEDQGVKFLGFFDSGFRWMVNDVKEAKSFSDYKGLKIRTPETPLLVDIVAESGALPASLSMTEVASALQQGIFDGMEAASTPSLYTRDLHKELQYWTETKHCYSACVGIMNMDSWNALNKQQQEDLMEAMAIATPKQYEWNQNFIKECTDKMINEDKIQFYFSTPELMKEVVAVGKKLAYSDRYSAILGEEMLSKMYPDNQ